VQPQAPRLLHPPDPSSLYPAQVKKKMSREDFIKNNRGINDGADLGEDFMGALYERITTNEIKVGPGCCCWGTGARAGGARGAQGGAHRLRAAGGRLRAAPVQVHLPAGGAQHTYDPRPCRSRRPGLSRPCWPARPSPPP
jgi:hypothetical protein